MRIYAALISLGLAAAGCAQEPEPRPPGPGPTPAAEPTIVSVFLGDAATIRGPDEVELTVTMQATVVPPVPLNLSAETNTFLAVALILENTGTEPYTGNPAEGAQLTTAPVGDPELVTLADIPPAIAESLSQTNLNGVDTLEAGEEVSGEIVYRIAPRGQVRSFEFSIPGGPDVARWELGS